MDQPTRDGRLGRRLLVLRVAGLGAAAAATGSVAEAASGTARPATPAGAVEPARTDNDPYDAAGYGRRGYGGGRTDNDPRDAPGGGRGYSGGYAPRHRSVTDNDPRDAAGGGRGSARRAAA